MFTESADRAAEKFGDKLICESCGVEFSCGANAEKCWCFSIEIKTETLADLRETFKYCLCKSCLEVKINGKKEE